MTTYTKEEAEFLKEVHAECAKIVTDVEIERFPLAIERVCNKESKVVFSMEDAICITHLREYVTTNCYIYKGDKVVILGREDAWDENAVEVYRNVKAIDSLRGFVSYAKKVDVDKIYGDLDICSTLAVKPYIEHIIGSYNNWDWGLEYLSLRTTGDYPCLIMCNNHDASGMREFISTVLEYYNYFYAEAQDMKVAQD